MKSSCSPGGGPRFGWATSVCTGDADVSGCGKGDARAAGRSATSEEQGVAEPGGDQGGDGADGARHRRRPGLTVPPLQRRLPDGMALPLPEQVLIGQVVAQNLAVVGVDVRLNQMPGSQWLRHYFSGDWAGAHILETSFNNTIHGDVIRSIETAICLEAGAFYCDEDMLPLIEASNREFDQETRKKMLQELATLLHYDPRLFTCFLILILWRTART